MMPNIMKRFFEDTRSSRTVMRFHEPVTGWGLAGALILAQSMGGTIEIISQKGKGATFRLTLPLVMNSQGQGLVSSTPLIKFPPRVMNESG